jgi:O-antigen ligase
MGEWMEEARSARLIGLGRTIVASVIVLIITLGLGYVLGSTLVTPKWQDAVRYTVMGALAFVIFASPVNGLFLWMLMAPFAQASYTEIWRLLNIRMPPGIPDLTPDRLAVGLLSVVLIAQLAVGKRRGRRLGLELYMAAFCIMALPAIAASLSGINGAGQQVLDKFIVPFGVFVLAKNLYEERISLDKLCATLAVIGLYLSFMIFYEHLTGDPLFTAIGRTTVYTRSLRKIVSLLGNPAFLGTVLGMIVPMALYKALHDHSRNGRAFYAALFVTALLGNFFCYNRGAWLALAVGLVVLLLERRYRQVLLPVILVAALVGLVYWQIISETAVVSERLSNVSSLRFRLDLLTVSLQLIRDHPLFGVGVGNFAYYFLQYGGHWETLAFDLPTPHNTFVLILSTMGLVAFVPYAMVFVSMALSLLTRLARFRGDWRVDKALLVSGLGVVAVYVVSSAAVDLYVNVFNSLIFYLITGTIMGYVSDLRFLQRTGDGTRGNAAAAGA